MAAQPKTLLDAVTFFASPDNCREYLVARRWPNGVTCPQCGSSSVYFDSSRNGWECKTRHPKRKFTLKTGTIFEDSPLGLDKWLPTVWMIANCKNGVSSREIHRAIGVTQKTAWFMLQRIRLAMQAVDGGKLDGVVEIDETFIGGKSPGHGERFSMKAPKGRKGPNHGKAVVMGLLERESPDGAVRVRTRIVPDRDALDVVVREHVEAGSSVMTDALMGYRSLADSYEHQFVDHAGSYVEGQVHRNGLENFWALLKRALKGTYINVEPFHLFRYLDEQTFRFNNRKDVNDADRFSEVIRRIVGRRLTYAELIAANPGTQPA
jgi:transposase-like protein